jgi:hypothetical protein
MGIGPGPCVLLRITLLRGSVHKNGRTDQGRRSVAPLRPDAEAGHRLGDELVVPSHPVALSEFSSGL